MKQIYFLFVVLLVAMTALQRVRKRLPLTAEQLMFQIDSVDHVTGLQRVSQVSRIDQHILSVAEKI